MAASAPANLTSIEKPIRTRRSHGKVRTGCLTCKIRRKKCDETKPSCRRCTGTGRKCDGYDADVEKPSRLLAPLSSTTSTSIAAQACDGGTRSDLAVRSFLDECAQARTRSKAGASMQIWRPPALSLFATEKDYFCFDFFQHRTGPEFSGYFDSSFWQGFLVQACFANPAVRQAAVALGAVHRRSELGITPEAFEYCDYSARSYTKALRLLREDLGGGGSHGLEISMMSSMLLASFETFQGNYETAAQHMLGGLKIMFDREFRKLSSKSRKSDAVLNEDTLRNLFTRMESQSTLYFQKPPKIAFDPTDGGTIVDIPDRFDDLDDARDTLFTLVHQLLHAVVHDERDASGRFASHQEYIIRLLQWSCAYATFSKGARKGSLVHERPYRILRTYREAAYLLLLAQPDFETVLDHFYLETTSQPGLILNSQSEWRKAMNAHFNKLLIVADGQLDMPTSMTGFAPGRIHSFSVDSGIGPPLYLAPHIGSSTKVRPQTASLLPGSIGHQQIWDQPGVYNVAEKLTSMEEKTVIACGALPAVINAKWLDVTCFLEERRVLKRYCAPDKLDGRLIWTEEWMAY